MSKYQPLSALASKGWVLKIWVRRAFFIGVFPDIGRTKAEQAPKLISTFECENEEIELWRNGVLLGVGFLTLEGFAILGDFSTPRKENLIDIVPSHFKPDDKFLIRRLPIGISAKKYWKAITEGKAYGCERIISGRF